MGIKVRVKLSEVNGDKQSEVNGQEVTKSFLHFLASKFKNALWAIENNRLANCLNGQHN